MFSTAKAVVQLGEIVSISQDTILRLIVNKLANILYQNVECSVKPREEIDWLTAEKLVIDLGMEKVRKIKDDFTLLRVSEFFSLVGNGETTGSAPVNEKIDDAFERLMGRKIWDQYYQKAKRLLPPDYTKILYS